MAGAIIAALLYALFSVVASRSGDPPSQTAAPRADIEKAVDTGAEGLAADASPQAPEDALGAFLLQINAVEETWLKVIVDRQDPKEYLLNPGDRLELKAASGFNLLIGNAAGIHLQLNHQAIPIDGKHGQVVTLKLPK